MYNSLNIGALAKEENNGWKRGKQKKQWAKSTHGSSSISSSHQRLSIENHDFSASLILPSFPNESRRFTYGILSWTVDQVGNPNGVGWSEGQVNQWGQTTDCLFYALWVGLNILKPQHTRSPQMTVNIRFVHCPSRSCIGNLHLSVWLITFIEDNY